MNRLFSCARYLQGIGIKKLIGILLISGIFMMPESLLHLLAVMLHTVYEIIAFAIEHVLVHGAGLEKFQAQIIVFYGSLAIGVLAAITLFRRIPQMLANAKSQATEKYNQMRADLLDAWSEFSTWRKIALMIVHFAGMFSIMVFLIS